MPFYYWYPTLIGLAVGFVFMNMPPLADQFMDLFGAGHGGLAFCLGGLAWAHALMQIPAGLAVDKLGVRKMLLLATAIGAAANLLPFLEPSSLHLATAARVAIGCCTALLIVTGMKIITVLAPPGRMAGAQGLYGGTFGVGSMLPYVVLSYLGGAGTWRYSYIFACLLFALALAGSFALPAGRFGPAPSRGEGSTGIRTILGLAARSKAVWVLGIMHGFSFGTLTNLGQWMPSMLADLSVTSIASWNLAATLMLMAGSLSRMLSGPVLGFLSRSATINGVIMAIAASYLCLGLSPWPYVTLAVGILLALICGLNFGSLFTMGGQSVPPIAMATALALLNMVANIGSVFLTLLLGNTREHTGNFHYALLAAAALATATWLATKSFVKRLDARLGKLE